MKKKIILVVIVVFAVAVSGVFVLTKCLKTNSNHEQVNVVEEKAPLHRNVTTTQVGNVATFLLSNMSDAITGQVIYADSGYSIMGV